MGACRSNELYNMKLSDIEDVGSQMIVSVPNAKTRRPRQFTLKDSFFNICKKYMSNRTDSTNIRLFHQYKNMKFTNKRIGLSTFSRMGKDIACFLNLPNPEKYTGHSFRRSSATILVDADEEEDIISLQKHDWKPSSVAEDYGADCSDSPLKQINHTTTKMKDTINYEESSSGEEEQSDFTPNESNVIIPARLPVVFNNCSNLTININNK